MTSATEPTESTTYRYDVFVSYADADAGWVLEWLLPRLKEAGLTVAIDEETFALGAPVLAETERAIEESRYTLAVLSEAWVQSNWDGFEGLLVQHADPGARLRKLIPLKLEADVDPPRRIQLLQWVDMTDPQRRQEQLERVVAAVRGEGRLPELRYERIPTARQRWWELRWYTVAGIAAVLTLVLLSWWIWRQRAPTVMPEGSFNIAVAPFEAVDRAGEPVRNSEARTRAISIVRFLRNQAKSLAEITRLDVVVWGPEEGIDPVMPTTLDARAEDLNANVIIYGTLREVEDKWQLEPAFFLADKTVEQAFERASEWGGEYALGRPIVYDRDNPVDAGDVNQDITLRLQALAHLLRGFVYLAGENREDYDKALQAFQDATESEWGQTDSDTGQEILYHFLGNAYLQNAFYAEQTQASFEERRDLLLGAYEAFLQALDFNSDYIRAYNGVAGALFQMARLSTPPGQACPIDEAHLEEARDWYQRALDAADQSRGDVAFHAHFGLGRVALSRALCREATTWGEASAHFHEVIALYEAEPRHRRRGALLAYTELANVNYFNPAHQDLPAGDPVWEQGIEYTEKAVALAQEIDTEWSLSVGKLSMAYLLNFLCRNDQADQIGATLDDFVETFSDPQAARDDVLDVAKLPEECTHGITQLTSHATSYHAASPVRLRVRSAALDADRHDGLRRTATPTTR